MDTGNMADQSRLEDVMPQNYQLYVWRYMNVAALLWILQTKSIFFTRITKLQRDDPYEGAMSRSLKRLFGDKEEAVTKGVPVSAELEDHSKLACVNCWHLNEEESAAMWKLYSSDLGVAIQSRVSILEGIFEGKDVKMAKVQYIDFEGDVLPALPYPAYHKRKSHEKELRFVILNDDLKAHPDGVPVDVDLQKLLIRVYVSPSAKPWIAEVVRRELEHYGLRTWVTHSQLYSRALK
jgi:hypothetical protein